MAPNASPRYLLIPHTSVKLNHEQLPIVNGNGSAAASEYGRKTAPARFSEARFNEGKTQQFNPPRFTWRTQFTCGQKRGILTHQMDRHLVVNEVFLSLQGESTYAGLPCILVRLTGCDLRCSYCDTTYAFNVGRRMSVAAVRAEVRRLAEPFLRTKARAGKLKLPLVELTGGEPLLQRGSLRLMKQLCDDGFVVLLETNGAHDIARVDPRVRRIVDIKCPSSGEAHHTRWENIRHLKRTDEVKFVIGTVQDYEWAKEQLARYKLARRCTVLFGWAHPLEPHQRVKSLRPVPADHTPLTQRQLAERIISDALPVRFQVQLHKVIWPPDMRGV